MNRKKKNENSAESTTLTVDDAVALIRSFLTELKFDRELCEGKISEDENRIEWFVPSNVSRIEVEISISELKSEDPCFLINSYIASLPETGILRFYRRCLELNDELIDGNLNADGKNIALTTRRMFSWLTTKELNYKLRVMLNEAPDIAKKLRAEFNSPAQPPD